MENKNQSTNNLLLDLSFCVIDLETTGGNPATEQIIEIGLVRIENMKITEEISFLVNPEKNIPDFVQKLTGIKMDDVKNSPKIEEILDEVVMFIGKSILVAHNISFDIPFLNGILKKYQRPQLENKVICTNIMTKYLIPEIVSTNLNFMAQIFNLQHSQAHRAIEDAKATSELFIKYLNIFKQKGIRKINQLYYPRNHFELDRIHFEKDLNQLSQIKSFLDLEDRPLYLIVKNEKGVILSALPIENAKKCSSSIIEFIKGFDWTLITIKLIGPMTEGIFYFNEDYLKIPEASRKETLNFITDLFPISENTNFFDFVVTPHLIQGQLIIYPMNQLAAYQKLIFKYPAHKKKLTHYLTGHVQKIKEEVPRKRFALHKEIQPIFLSFLNRKFSDKNPLYVFTPKGSLQSGTKELFVQIESLIKNNPDVYSFPKKFF